MILVISRLHKHHKDSLNWISCPLQLSSCKEQCSGHMFWVTWSGQKFFLIKKQSHTCIFNEHILFEGQSIYFNSNKNLISRSTTLSFGSLFDPLKCCLTCVHEKLLLIHFWPILITGITWPEGGSKIGSDTGRKLRGLPVFTGTNPTLGTPGNI